MSNRESIDGARGGQTGCNGVLYAAPEPSLPSPVPRRVAKRKKDQRVRAVARQVRRTAPHLDNPAFAPLLQGFARVSILLSDAYEKVRNMELIGDDGELRPSIETIRRLVDTQAKLAEKLGITPATMRQFNKEKAVDFAALLASDAE